MKVQIELTEDDIKSLISDHLRDKLKLQLGFDPSEIRIETRPKYIPKSTWEVADFRAIYQSP